MKITSDSRRKLVKAIATGIVMTPFIPITSLATNIEKNPNNDFSDDDYVVVNGWVLLKSDISPD